MTNQAIQAEAGGRIGPAQRTETVTEELRRADHRLAGLTGAVFFVTFAVAAFLWMSPWPDVLSVTDFVAFRTGAAFLRDGAGGQLYDLEAQRAFQMAMRAEFVSAGPLRNTLDFSPYFNPPPLALMFVPLAALPIPWAFGVWSLISMMVLVASVALLLRGRPLAATSAALLITFAGVASTILEGQVNGLFVLAISLSMLSMSAGRPFLGGVLLGFLWLKPQYLAPLLAVLVLKRRWTELAGIAVSGVAFGLLSLGLVGADGVRDYLGLLGRMSAYVPEPGLRLSAEKMVNWRALFLGIGLPVPEVAGSTLLLFLAVGSTAFALLAWRGPWEPTSPRFPRQMLAITLAAIIGASHSHFHGIVLILAPLALAIARPTGKGREKTLWVAALLLGNFLAMILWMLTDWRWLLVPFFVAAQALLVVQCRAVEPPPGRELDCRPILAQDVRLN